MSWNWQQLSELALSDYERQVLEKSLERLQDTYKNAIIFVLFGRLYYSLNDVSHENVADIDGFRVVPDHLIEAIVEELRQNGLVVVAHPSGVWLYMPDRPPTVDWAT